MKKKTLIAKLREDAKLREVKGQELELAVGGIPTMTNCDGTCQVHWIQGDTPPV